MKTYEFKYTVTPKENADWWCDIRNKSFETDAENLNDAKKDFCEHLENVWCINISKTAMKNPEKMYRDRKDAPPEIIGFVFTGHHEVQFESGWKERICWVWSEIKETKICDEI